jgi:hypothetical protein
MLNFTVQEVWLYDTAYLDYYYAHNQQNYLLLISTSLCFCVACVLVCVCCVCVYVCVCLCGGVSREFFLRLRMLLI